jgi:putative hydrolase of the HAD superfamily
VPRQALLFDLDDTLIADTTDTLAALAETCALVEPVAERCSELAAAVKARAWELWASPAYGGAIGHELGISGTEAMFSDFRVGHDTVRQLTESHLSFEREVWEQCLAAHGVRSGPEQVDELRRSFRETRVRHVTLYEEVVASLEDLATDCSLAVVTNGPSDLQRLKLTATGLDRLFPIVVISGELGHGKPAPEPFLEAVRLLGVAVEATVMVGDSLTRDVAGAHGIGMRVVRVDRPRSEPKAGSAGTDPPPTISDLRSLRDAVASVGASSPL